MSPRRERERAAARWEVCYATPIAPEAHLVKGFLEHYGVPCMLDDRRFAAQPLTFCALGELALLVPTDWAHVARGLIKGREARSGTRTIRRAIRAVEE